MVEVDPSKVERVIENLLVNAARYTPPGTAVLVQVTARPDGIVLVVEDDGPGIPDELKDVLFEPFRQGEDSSGRGVGIGLSLVQRFAELHGGLGAGSRTPRPAAHGSWSSCRARSRHSARRPTAWWRNRSSTPSDVHRVLIGRSIAGATSRHASPESKPR